jgi:hypothetical protein
MMIKVSSVSTFSFRDGEENMGAHSDDDQGEQCIHSVIIKAPNEGKAAKNDRRWFYQICIVAESGDAYEMDGTFGLFNWL